MIKLWAICRNTFVQTIRQPIYGVLILATFAVLVLELPLAGWTMGSEYHKTDQKMLVNLGLGTLVMSGLFLSAFSASRVLAREIEDKTALTVIAKPVWRWLFVLGKFAGVAAAVAAAYYLCSLVFLMTVRHKVMPAATDPYDWPVIVIGLASFGLVILTALGGNLLFGWTFTSAGVWSALVLMSIGMGAISVIGKGWKIVPFGQDISPQIILALVLMLMSVMIFAAVAVSASTRLGQAMTLMVCLVVFCLGSMHPYLFGRWSDNIVAARLLGWAAPKLTYFDPLHALTLEAPIPGSFAWLAAAYCVVYIAAALAVGMALFQRKQLEAQMSSSSLPGAVGLLAWAGRLAAVACGVTAAFILSVPKFYTARGLLAAAGLAAAAVGGWVLWGCFSRGAKWTYWLVLVIMILLVGPYVVSLFAPAATEVLRLGQGSVVALIEAIVAAVIIAVLILPKTRRHFASA
ncbi:MAG: ABC transporter permease subunit [Planctomycetota bacterium]|jgi:ABC-type transport system involved in multi-copper enzyme maturation permease subunit